MGVTDTFQKLKLNIIGTKTTDIDAKLDKAVKDIISYKSNSGRNGYIDLVRSLISKEGTGGISLENGVTASQVTPAAMGQGSRLIRYRMYETIVSHINYCFRGLRVLVDNILAPDDITKTSLEINPKKFLEDETPTEAKTGQVKQTIKKLKLEDHLDLLVTATLKYGDFFVEIADEKTALTSRAYLAESTLLQDLQSGIKEKISDKKLDIILDYTSFEKNEDKKEAITIDNLSLLYHEPLRVIKLQSEMFPLCFGYLVFPKTAIIPQLYMKDQAVNDICRNILNSLHKKIPQMKEVSDNKELQLIIASMVKGTDNVRTMNIRYIPPNKMQHFCVPSTTYYPYGESIFDTCQFSAKVLIALETALAVHRLSRSTEKRKVSVEVGLPRDAKKLVEGLKEEFRKRKISLDSFGSIDTIPSMISTFEDIYVPQKDGKPFVDISTFTEGNVDIRGKVDELKYLRDSVVASLGVPASFLNIEENLSNKCIDLATKIPLLSGKVTQLQDLIYEFNETGTISNKYSYSYDKGTGKIVPGKIIWAGITRKNAKVVRVTLDNGKSEIVTPDHHYMLRNGEYIEAMELKPGDSLMPLYTKLSHVKTTKRVPYQIIYHPGIDEWEVTHRAVAKHEGMIQEGDRLNVHHNDFNPMNNNPNNLTGLSNKDHLKIHIEHKDFITTGRGKIKKENYTEDICIICGETYTKHIASNQITCLKDKCKKERASRDGKKNGKKTNKQIFYQCPFCKELFSRAPSYTNGIKSSYMTCGKKECYKKSFTLFNNTPIRKEIASKAGIIGGNKSKIKLVAYNKEHGAPMKGKTKETHPDLFDQRTQTVRKNKKMNGLNHKVLSVEILDYTIDTGDITVEKYHNFAVESGVIISNSALSEENILFARTVVNHQKYLTIQINNLIQKIYEIISPEDALTILDNVSVSFPPPKSLQFEREARYMGELANLVETLERIGIPKEYSRKKFLTGIDWTDLKNYEIDEKIEAKLGTAAKDPNDMGMGGGMGGMGGGAPAF